MIIGFFSDDGSAVHAALLANVALNRDQPIAPEILSVRARIGAALMHHLDEATERGHHALLALPFAEREDVAIRARLDLAVLTAGPGPVYGGLARQAAAFEDRHPKPGIAPAWLLGGPELRRCGAVRRLPVAMQPMRLDDAVRLRLGCSCGAIHRRAIGLAATLLIAADDPYADAIDPAEVASLIQPDDRDVPPPFSPRLRDDLLDLAADLDDGPASAPTADAPRLGSARDLPVPGRRSRRFRPRRQPPSAIRRHDDDCIYSTAR